MVFTENTVLRAYHSLSDSHFSRLARRISSSYSKGRTTVSAQLSYRWFPSFLCIVHVLWIHCRSALCPIRCKNVWSLQYIKLNYLLGSKTKFSFLSWLLSRYLLKKEEVWGFKLKCKPLWPREMMGNSSVLLTGHWVQSEGNHLMSGAGTDGQQ